ncbi:M48 family metallopeptidase [Alicyclobacillus fastidiosus]|uniref:M48 family metallopeptidase n=1 Tax=Alicyclobacillus fastidiosus TaxID=392011 RepID=A0ABY6ZP22_9BACL|nr:SprT family zinc-dependent metalloprotease [Alicyclobacillus fastidiosus]WAH44328.1 M48 family metallopeptidase [Alicyclobacillus fastidiosus]GMA60657.1 hypothetical protein GCM10025859_10970 [Alicyclobacillus fastidiosus]
MNHLTLGDGSVISYVRVPPRARQVRVILRVVDGTLQVSAPRRVMQSSIERVIRQHQTWVLNELERTTNRMKRPVAPGDRILLFGKDWTIVQTSNVQAPACAKSEQAILVPPYCSDADCHRAVYELLREIAAQRLHPFAQALAQQFHLVPNRIVVKEQKRRWGSCSSKRNINLNWRLIQAPQDVQAYVVVHELAHLEQMNHSDQFWKLVRAMMPEFETHRNWLYRHGERLHDLQPDGMFFNTR